MATIFFCDDYDDYAQNYELVSIIRVAYLFHSFFFEGRKIVSLKRTKKTEERSEKQKAPRGEKSPLRERERERCFLSLSSFRAKSAAAKVSFKNINEAFFFRKALREKRRKAEEKRGVIVAG